MKRTLLFLLAALTSCLMAQPKYEPTWESVDKRPTPAWFTNDKFGIFIHWGVYSVPAYGPVGKYAEWYWNALAKGPMEKDKPNPTYEFHKKNYGENYPYENFAPQFRAEMYDPAYWAKVFQESGAKYIVLTSKHHEGFTLWQNEQANKAWGRPWNAVEVGPKRDVLGDLTTEVRKRGLKMGFYYSLYEWYNPLWKKDRKAFVTEHMHPQFKDLVTKYKPSIIFADGEWDMPSADWKAPELLSWLFNESAVKDEVVINDRWGKDSRHKHGGYYTTEYTAGLESNDHPWEESRGMGFSYGYNRAEQIGDYRSDRELILMLIDLVSRGSNLLPDIGPTADGRIPVIMQERLLNMGKWLKVNGEAIYGTRPWSSTRQWSTGAAPKLETGEYMTRYEVTDYVEAKKPGQAVIETFFTVKGDDVYAIIPGWPTGGKLALKNVTASAGMKASVLGGSSVRWSKDGSGIALTLPQASGDATKGQHAWVVKLPGLKAAAAK